MRGRQTGSAPLREPPSGGSRKAQLDVCPESRSASRSVGSERKILTFRLKVTIVRHAPEHLSNEMPDNGEKQAPLFSPDREPWGGAKHFGVRSTTSRDLWKTGPS
jgi:hypothetical protein